MTQQIHKDISEEQLEHLREARDEFLESLADFWDTRILLGDLDGIIQLTTVTARFFNRRVNRDPQVIREAERRTGHFWERVTR